MNHFRSPVYVLGGAMVTPAFRPDLDSIIVGAGFSGLSAGARLQASGRRFLLLEATDHVGGRARSGLRIGSGRPNELGALMIHGRGVITHEWARRHGLHVRKLPVLHRSRIVYRRRVGRYPWFALPFHPAMGTRATVEGIRTVPRALFHYTGPDRSLATLEEEWKVSGRARLLVELLHAHVYAVDPDSIGVRGNAEEDHRASEPYSYHNFQLVEGYSALATRAAGTLSPNVRLNTEVTQVLCEDSGVRVRGRTTSGEVEYHARTAVITVPLGVLKSGAIIFDPPLPEAKRRAIDRIGIGDGYALSMRLRGGTMRARLGDFCLLWGGGATTFYRPYVGLSTDVEVLTAFTVGREARRRVGLGREGLVAATLEEWAGVVPEGVTVGTVEDTDVHLWSLDPWTRGTYSYLPPGVMYSEREELARPVDHRLFFAGEATNLTGEAATVSGAILAGARAADEVLAELSSALG